MKKTTAQLKLSHEFVEFVPQRLQAGVLYISMNYATTVHLCFCGCNREVVAPLSPTDWKLTFDGERVSLSPSIGNWNFPCRSHYWIEDGCVLWCGEMSQKAIDAGRAQDQRLKAAYFDRKHLHDALAPRRVTTELAKGKADISQGTVRGFNRIGWFTRLKAWLYARI